MRRDIILRIKALYSRGIDKMSIITLLQKRYNIDSGTAGSYVQQAFDEMEVFENAKTYRYWNLLGGFIFLVLAILGVLFFRKYMTLFHSISLISISIIGIRKGWNQIVIYRNEIEERKSDFEVYF